MPDSPIEPPKPKGIVERQLEAAFELRAPLLLAVVVLPLGVISPQFREMLTALAERCEESGRYEPVFVTYVVVLGAAALFHGFTQEHIEKLAMTRYIDVRLHDNVSIFGCIVFLLAFFFSALGIARDFRWAQHFYAETFVSIPAAVPTLIILSTLVAIPILSWRRRKRVAQAVESIYADHELRKHTYLPPFHVQTSLIWISVMLPLIVAAPLFFEKDTLTAIADHTIKPLLPEGQAVWFEPIPGYEIYLMIMLTAIWASILLNITQLFVPVEALIALLFAYMVFGLADSYGFRHTVDRGAQLSTLKEAFASWLSNRPDLKEYRGKRYPIYIVAAEGGGQYAAVHASTILGRLQDLQPRFAQHTFAASGVSGGSLGLAVFSGLVQRYAVSCTEARCPRARRFGTFTDLAERYAAFDVLSPTTLRSTTIDLVQLFLPLKIEGFDRATTLERKLEAAWMETVEHSRPRKLPNPMAQPYSAHWDPAGIGPALVLNATEVETGRRIAVAPFSLTDLKAERAIDDLASLQDEMGGVGLAMSTAVVLSARFPIVSPAARYTSGSPSGRRVQHLVDGGYFDNTGIETALDILRHVKKHAELAELAQKHDLAGIDFRLLSITAEAPLLPPATVGAGLSGLLSPVRTMMTSIHSRRALTLRNAERELTEERDVPVSASFHRVTMYPGDIELPLSWFLAAKARRRIVRELSAQPDCPTTDARTPKARNDCALSVVVQSLSPPK
jgi:hypothetical protein